MNSRGLAEVTEGGARRSSAAGRPAVCQGLGTRMRDAAIAPGFSLGTSRRDHGARPSGVQRRAGERELSSEEAGGAANYGTRLGSLPPPPAVRTKRLGWPLDVALPGWHFREREDPGAPWWAICRLNAGKHSKGNLEEKRPIDRTADIARSGRCIHRPPPRCRCWALKYPDCLNLAVALGVASSPPPGLDELRITTNDGSPPVEPLREGAPPGGVPRRTGEGLDIPCPPASKRWPWGGWWASKSKKARRFCSSLAAPQIRRTTAL